MPAACASALCLALAGAAEPESPRLLGALPHAAVPGDTVEVTLLGEHLEGATGLWASFKCQALPARAGAAAYRLEVPGDVRPGIGALRVATTGGISSPLLFVLDGLPGAREGGGNHAVLAAEDIAPPVAVDGACEEERSDFFRFAARAGEEVSIEVVARRMGSPLDPRLRLLDARGRELAVCDDAPALGGDPRLSHRFAESGPCVIEVRDTAYAGGAGHRYRLRVGGRPLPVPEAPGGVEEAEPNGEPARANRIAVPGAVRGRFIAPRDRDLFEFEARKGERLRFRGLTRSLGSPSELYLALLKTDGARVAQSDPTKADEGLLEHAFGEDGVHRLLVEELSGQGGPDQAYRIEVERVLPGFTLGAAEDRLEPPEGGTASVEVTCARRDYDGPITLSLEGAPEGFTLDGATIPEKQTSTRLKVTPPRALKAGEFVLVRIAGRARIGERQVRVAASVLPALRRLFPETIPLPPELDGQLAIAVRAGGAPPAASPDESLRKKARRSAGRGR